VGVVAVGGSAEVFKIAAAASLAKSTEIAEVQKGLLLDPENPELCDRLSRLETDSLQPVNLLEAVRQARRATELNPRQFSYCLQLASACESAGDQACAGQAFEHALGLAPRRPQVWWAAANYYVRAGQREAALSCFRRLLEIKPDYAAQAFDVALRAYGDPELIWERIVARSTDIERRLAFVNSMSANDRFDAAHQAWTRIESSGPPVPFATTRPYLERLLSHRRFEEAQAVWSRLEQWGAIPKPADSDPANLVFNGGFEQTPLEAGFDWRSFQSPYVSVDFADSSAYRGARCLRVDFPVGQNDEFEPVYQVLLLAPNQAYTLSAYVRTQDITSDSGLRLRVVDLACPNCLDESTEATVGSTPWRQVVLRFNSGPQTRAVWFSLWRPRSRTFPMELSGTFWLDAVRLQENGLGKGIGKNEFGASSCSAGPALRTCGVLQGLGPHESEKPQSLEIRVRS
jgi:tetratricopeptide (TPR) repeat protein